jgi:hypothetical protein
MIRSCDTRVNGCYISMSKLEFSGHSATVEARF